MIARFFRNIAKLIKLLASGEYVKIINAFKLRVNRLFGGHDLRAEIHQFEQEVTRVLWEHFGINNEYRSDTTKVAVIVRGGRIMPKSSAFVRLIAPLAHSSVSDNISVKVHPENTVKPDPETDICIVQRTAYDRTSAVKRLVRFLRQYNIGLVVDTDDAFHRIDRNHSEFRHQTKWAKALEYLVSYTDQLWVSTQELAKLYETPPNCSVINNTLDSRLWHINPESRHIPPESDLPLQIIYMGTASHHSDLGMILPALDDLATQYPDSFELTVIGITDKNVERPWMTRLRQPKFVAMYPNFVNWFLQQGPFDIGLSPLEDNAFNRSKSDIKALDYLAAGIIPVVSDVLPYQTPKLEDCIIKVSNEPDHWRAGLAELINDVPGFRRYKSALIQKANAYIWQERSTQQSAQTIQEHLSRLVRR